MKAAGTGTDETEESCSLPVQVYAAPPVLLPCAHHPGTCRAQKVW